MNPKQTTRISKFLSMVLRHRPETIGLTLDNQGWADVDELVQKAGESGRNITPEMLDHVVENNNKKRFAFNEDKTRIRASQGHSINIDLGYEPAVPPEVLFHGTAQKFVGSIFAQGLQKRKRHHVHLSADKATALTVGGRHGSPVIFEVQAGEMHRQGHKFFVSANGVWLTEEVPVAFLVKMP
ncbi:MAG: RNA 2'-phosphotransferase [Bacteroidota bacterium]